MTRTRSLPLLSGLCLATTIATLGLISEVSGGSRLAPGPTIILNEFLYDPAADATGDANKDTVTDVGDDEFVEFVNITGSAIDMTAWKLYDGSNTPLRHVFPVGTVLQPGCAIVIFGGGHPPVNLFAGAIVQTADNGGTGTQTLGLNNGTDTITLKDAGDVTIFTHTYTLPSDVNQSYTRDPDLIGGTYVQHSTAAGSAGTLFSPGRRINGNAFGACVLPTPDQDGDGHPDATDNCPGLANPDQGDCDNSGVGDVCEIDENPGLDANQNGILDACEPDCNGTQLPDDLDIKLGLSLDCNGNMIPDECEVPPIGSHDCNQNGIPDDCDIANGAPDVDQNGIPDVCESNVAVVINEIMSSPNSDTNGDGFSDIVQDEFLEVINGTASPQNISGWSLSDATQVRHVFPVGTVLAPNCGVTVWGGGTPVCSFAGIIKQVSSSGNLGLANDGDTITLRDASNLLVDQVTYTSPPAGVSKTRSPDITGAFVNHTVAQAGVNFSPGRMVNLAGFPGCTSPGPDTDNDCVADSTDNCDNTPNPLQQDCDHDNIGDACETDPDSNGNQIPDNCEIGTPGNVRLNEIRIDQTGTDNDEYFEIKGPANLSLNGLTVIVLGDPSAGGGGSGSIESITSLSGKIIPADGHFLCVEPSFTMAAPAQRDFVTAANALNFENGENVTFALVTNFTGAINQDLDTDNNGTIDVTPWGAVVDAVGLVIEPNPPTTTEWAYGAALGGTNVGPDDTFVPSQIYRCETVGIWTIGNFDPVASPITDSPGVLNTTCPASACIGDANTNGVVDIDDLVLVITHWAQSGPIGDINTNGVVDIDDLVLVITHWGACP
jgi:hypothetical protein